MARITEHPAAKLLPLLSNKELKNLAESIKKNGLRQPIVLCDGKVLDGRNRLKACRIAGVKPRFVQFKRKGSPWRFVWDQNVERRHLKPGQRVVLLKKFLAADEEWKKKQERRKAKANKARSRAAKKRPRKQGGRRFSSGVSADTPQDREKKKKRARDEVAEMTDTSPATVARIEALEKEAPDLYEKVGSGEMDVKEAFRELKARKKRQTFEQLQAEPQPLPEGPFRVVVADPPWRYETTVDKSGERGLVDYPDMSIKEIATLPVAKLAHDDCVLWLWITNSMLVEGAHVPVLKAWGFVPKALLTWNKEKMGTGHWLRNVTEHCILAIRGKPVVRLKNESTLISEKRRQHSRKPEKFYKMVERLCPGSKLEMFARKARKGWTVWGAEKEKYDDS